MPFIVCWRVMNDPLPIDVSTLLDIVSGLMPSWQPGTVTIDARLPGGYAHPNFRLHHDGSAYALRAPAQAPIAGELAFEADWLTSLPPGIGAEIIAFDTDTGAMLSRWIEAPLLAEVHPKPDLLVDYLVTLHDRLPPVDRPYNLVERVDHWLAGAPSPSAVTRARKRLHTTPVALQTTHNDLNPWNILCCPEGWRTLDWEWVGLNDPLFDLVTLGFGVALDATLLPHMAEDYLSRSYRANQQMTQLQLSDRLAQAITGYWLREYAWAVGALLAGSRRQEVIEQRDHARIMLEQL